MCTNQQQLPTTLSAARLGPSDEHHSYLLRLWRNKADSQWRASLQSVQTGERHMFADFESLLAFLVDHAQSSRQEPTA